MDTIQNSITQIIQETYGNTIVPLVSRPDPQFGDYATNVAMQLAKSLGRPPREIAEEIAAKLRENIQIAEVSIAGPGFINLKLADSTLMELATRPPQEIFAGSRYVVEYSCPNAFKELHTGHLYQTIVGDIIARLVEQAGAKTYRTSFGGDVGLHVAKCLWGIVAELDGEHPDKLTTIEANAFSRAQWISRCYVRGAAAYEQDEAAKQQIDQLNKTIYRFHDANDHESSLAKIYWTTRQWSFDYFDSFYTLLDVDHMRYYPESVTAPVGLDVVHAQLEKGNLTESDGAVVFAGDTSKHLHTRVFITSKGLPTYETKDIGVIWLEKQEYEFDRRILITGNDQKEYMRVVYAAAETFDPTLTGMMTHLTNGTVRFGDGKKMSSRLGNVSRAIEVFEIVREKVKSLVADEALIEPVTLGAIKYVFAKYRLGGDIAFDIDETVSLAGNSGPYLQYAHARAQSIVAKSTLQATVVSSEAAFDDSERLLVQKLGGYAEAVELATQEFAPHHICNYLFELAQEFNRFYEKSRIIGDEREELRLGLVVLYRDTLARGLGLLGITAPETM